MSGINKCVHRGVDVLVAYDVAVSEISAALYFCRNEVAVWLDTYTNRLFSAQMLAYVSQWQPRI